MSDLPPPYSIPAYASNDHSTKIKFKMPAAHITAPTPANSHVNATLSPSGPTINSPGTLLLRIPALGTNTPTQPSKSLAPVPSNSPTVPPQIPPAPTTPIPTPQPLPSQTLAHAPTPPRPYVAPTPPTQPLIQPTPYTQPQYTTAYAPHYPGTVFPQARLPTTATAAAAAQTSIHPNTSPTTIHHATPQRPHVQTQMQPPPSTPRPPTTASGPSNRGATRG